MFRYNMVSRLSTSANKNAQTEPQTAISVLLIPYSVLYLRSTEKRLSYNLDNW